MCLPRSLIHRHAQSDENFELLKVHIQREQGDLPYFSSHTVNESPF
jgi:hypothetical protein